MNRLLALAATLAVAAAGSGAAIAAHSAASPEAVARAWSKALNANDNARSRQALRPQRARRPAQRRRLPLEPRDRDRVQRFAPLRAGASSRSTSTGNRAVATFVLGERPKHHCDAPGVKAAALFVVRNGKITLWQQVAVPKAGGGPIA